MALTLGELSGVITLDDKPFEKGLKDSQGKLEGFGAKGKVIAAAAGVAIGAALAAGIVSAMNIDKANDKLAAQLGLNAKESEKAGKTAGKLYANAYGSSMEEVTGAVGAVMSSIKGMREASSEEVEAMTAKVLDLAAAFEIDAGRAAQVAGQMITSGLARDGVHAADLLTASLQKVPAAVREDILDAVDEYAPFMANIGIKGEEAMGILVNASEKGMYGIDKTGDALKEFGIRATDMSKASKVGYDLMGMSQEEMSGKLLAGGDTAKAAFGKIVGGLQGIKDPLKQSEAALALFGTPLEDLSVTEIPNFLGAIDPMGDAFDSVAGAADAMGQTLNDNAATKIETFKRTAHMAFVGILGGQVLPVLEKVAGFLGATFGPAIDAIKENVSLFWAGLTLDSAGAAAIGAPLEGLVKIGADVREDMDKVIQKIKDFKEPIGVIAGLIVFTLIPHWVALGIEALKSAGQQVIAWAMAKGAAQKAAFVHSFAVMAMVGGWVLLAAQATINAGKIAAGWLIAMGPVGWIVAGIAALVAGFVLAYNNIGWFKDGVDAAMRWVGDAIAAVVDWFTGTAVPAWEQAVKAVGGFFTWLYESAIKPVFDGISAAITWVYESVIKPVFDGISAAVKFVGDVFTAFYEAAIKPTFDSIAVIVGGFYLFFRGIFQLVASVIENIVVPMIKILWDRFVEGFNGIGTVFTWLYENIVKPTFEGIGAVFTWLYENVVKPVFEGIGAAIEWVWVNVIKKTIDTWVWVFQNVLGPAFTWLYENVIKPVFEGIGKAIGWVWDNVLKPIFDTWVWVFQKILAPAFTWLYENVIKPAFDGIGNAIKWVWDNVLKPVFDFLTKAITEDIPKGFELGVAAIKKIWETIQDIAKAPIRFVIDTVINDGLIGAFNTIAGVLPGIDKLPRVALPAGFADGGYTGAGGKNDPAGIVHAGEIVWSQADIARHGGVGAVEGMRRGAGYADGGRVAPLKNLAVTQGYNRVHKGIDYAAQVGTPVFATESGTVSHAGPGARAPGVWGGNEVHLNGGSGVQSWYAHLSRIMVGIGDQVRAGQQIAASGNTGISSGPHLHFGAFAGGWPNDINPNAYLGGAGAPSGGIFGGFNPITGIIDGLVTKFRDMFPGGGMMADLAIGVGKKILDSAGSWVTKTLGGGDGNAAGPTVYDGGGWLQNTGGPQLVQHNKSKPDAVLSSEQWADIHKLALSGGKGDITYAPVFQPGPDFREQERLARTRFIDTLSVYA